MTLAMITTYACEAKLKKTSPKFLIAQTTTKTKKEANNTVKIALLLDTSNRY